MIKGGKNMSKGKEWVPCLRKNKTMMMKVNVDPIIMDKDLATAALYHNLGWRGSEKILSLKKKEVKGTLKFAAQYLTYFDYFEDAPRSREQIVEENARYMEWNLGIWDACASVITKHFPAFDLME